MQDTTYNGWTNYATWRVNLEIFDGIDAPELFDLSQEPYDLGFDLKTYAEEIMEIDGNHGLVTDYAFAFLSYVNWREIAKHMIEEYNDEPA